MKRRDADAGVAERATQSARWFVLPGDVEPALGGALLAPLRHEAARRAALERSGDAEHLLGRRHLEVERQVELGHQPVDVVVGDVAAVLAQVRGDAVGAGGLGDRARPRTGSGWSPPRAFRMVATWSMLTPRRQCGCGQLRRGSPASRPEWRPVPAAARPAG